MIKKLLMIILLVGVMMATSDIRRVAASVGQGQACCDTTPENTCACTGGHTASCQNKPNPCPDPITGIKGMCYCTSMDPVNLCGAFGTWGDWSSCYISGGICLQTRFCSEIPHIYQIRGCAAGECAACGDGSCNGSETCESCSQDCGSCCTPVNGGWSAWGTCSSCSQSRTCTNPAPNSCGSACSGSSSQSCGKVNGGWSAWGTCSSCSQSRTCTNPALAIRCTDGDDCGD
jgi:hypothetical protein